MTIFEASKCFAVATKKHYNYLTLNQDGMVQKFWRQEGANEFRKKRGCYIFGIMHGTKVTATYIGQATKSFGQEIFQPHKKNDHYIPALRERKNGAAVIMFVSHVYKSKPHLSSIDKLETQLIQQGVRKGLHLTNLRKTYLGELRIKGVFDFKKGAKPRGKVNGAAAVMRKMLKF